jgi:hypothetical protein
MARNTVGTFFPDRVNMHFRNAKYAADVANGGAGKVGLGPASWLPTAQSNGIIAAQSIATAVSVTTFATTYKGERSMGRFGRNVTLALSGAGTPAATVFGLDYLGQPLQETFNLTGATPVVGKKAFGTILRVDCALVAATTLNVGWGDILGLPYKLVDVFSELVDGSEATVAGTFVIGQNAAQTATSNDPRGTYTPGAGNLANGARSYSIYGLFDTENLYGNVHFNG